MSWLRELRKARIGSFGNRIDTRLTLLGSYIHFYYHDHGWIRAFYDNFSRVDEKLYRSGQPSFYTLKKAKRLGVSQIISFRNPGRVSYQLFEEKWTKELGLDFYSFGLSASQISNPDIYLQIIDLIDKNPKKTLIHCKSGADRSGLVSALYILSKPNRNFISAERMLHWKFGHFGLGKKSINRKFLNLLINLLQKKTEKNFASALKKSSSILLQDGKT